MKQIQKILLATVMILMSLAIYQQKANLTQLETTVKWKQSVPDLIVLDSCGIVTNGNGYGSYVAIDSNLVLTAKHCTDSNDLQIIDSGGLYHKVTSIWRSDKYDIAILTVDANLPFLPLGKMPVVLDEIYIVGSPLTNSYGHLLECINNITKGIVSKINVEWNRWSDGIIVNAAAYPGNSGGPLLDKRGKIIGIMVGCHNRMSDGGDNFWLAEPVSHIIESLEEYNNAQRIRGKT